MDRQSVHDEMRWVREDFHRLLDAAGTTDLRRPTQGTRWTNEQLLFHMMFGYLVVRALLPMVRAFGRLPLGLSGAYARLLDAATRPFDAINHAGAVIGARIYDHRRMGARLDRTLVALHRRLDAEPDAALARAMRFPARWDPFFTDVMTLAQVYRYPTRHYHFHPTQLTLPSGTGGQAPGDDQGRPPAAGTRPTAG